MIAAVGLASRPSLLARRDVERVVDALQRAVPVPQHEVVMRRALRRQVLRQRLPLAAGRQHVEDRVQNLAHIHVARPAAALGRRDHRLDQRPFGIGQIARIAQAATVGGAAMFRRPHRAPLASIRVPDNESQPIPPTQQLLGSALKRMAKDLFTMNDTTPEAIQSYFADFRPANIDDTSARCTSPRRNAAGV